MTFKAALDLFLQEKAAKNKPSTLSTTKGILYNHFKRLHEKALDEIRADDITRITDKLLLEYPSAANHALVACRTLLNWCVKRDYILYNPVSKLERPSATITRDRVLADDELRAIWKSTEGGGTFNSIVRLLLTTGQRRSEIASLRVEWCSLPSSKDGASLEAPAPLAVGGDNTDCEVTGDSCGVTTARTQGVISGALSEVGNSPNATIVRQCTITFPKEITKNKRAHAFPVGAVGCSILSTRMAEVSGGLLFPARTTRQVPFSGWSKSKAALDKKVSDHFSDGTKMVPWTLHDLRRTYAVIHQRLGTKFEIIECLLNHISGYKSGVAGIYQRYDFMPEMRDAVERFESWFTATIVSG
jgi:integrase